jgi:multidrug efflux system membrane fusion protein
VNTGTMVTVETVTQAPMPIYLDALGTVTPEHTASVYSQVAGRIDAVHYREGQMVHKGRRWSTSTRGRIKRC